MTRGKQTGSDLCFVSDADGAAILDVPHGTMSTLNSTGTRIWQALERGELPEHIVSHLASETGEDALVIERDVQDFVESLRSYELLPRGFRSL
jgi:hypothetical protein